MTCLELGLCSALAQAIFFFNDTSTTEISTLSLHDALPISRHNGAVYGIFESFSFVPPDQAGSLRLKGVAVQPGIAGCAGIIFKYRIKLLKQYYLVCPPRPSFTHRCAAMPVPEVQPASA